MNRTISDTSYQMICLLSCSLNAVHILLSLLGSCLHVRCTKNNLVLHDMVKLLHGIVKLLHGNYYLHIDLYMGWSVNTGQLLLYN